MHFSWLVGQILKDGQWQKKGTDYVPSECPRIELDQTKGGVVEGLPESLRQLARELVRRAVFIEIEPGLSRHGNVTTLRWHLRRVYLPTFDASLAKNNAIKKPAEWMRYLLTDPKGACEMAWDAWPKALSKKNQNSPQLPLEGIEGMI
jgi:hypothetical protein